MEKVHFHFHLLLHFISMFTEYDKEQREYEGGYNLKITRFSHTVQYIHYKNVQKSLRTAVWDRVMWWCQNNRSANIYALIATYSFWHVAILPCFNAMEQNRIHPTKSTMTERERTRDVVKNALLSLFFFLTFFLCAGELWPLVVFGSRLFWIVVWRRESCFFFF